MSVRTSAIPETRQYRHLPAEFSRGWPQAIASDAKRSADRPAGCTRLAARPTATGSRPVHISTVGDVYHRHHPGAIVNAVDDRDVR
jgi:hypothetical protein